MKKRWLLHIGIVLTLILIFVGDGLAEDKKGYPYKFFDVIAKSDFSKSGNSIVETADGYIVAGSVYDESGPSTYGWLIKVDKAGNKVWELELGKTSRDSAFYKMIMTNDGGLLIVGSINSVPAGIYEKSTGWIVKINTDGVIEWDQRLNFRPIIYLTDVISTKQNDVFVIGQKRIGLWNSPSVKDVSFVAKMDSKGNLLWSKDINKISSVSVLLRPKDGVIIAGDSRVAKINNRGDLISEYYLDNKNKYLISEIKQMADGGFIIGGKSKDLKSQFVFITKLSYSGKVEWNKRIKSTDLCSVAGLWISKNSEIVAVGETCSREQKHILGMILSKSGEIKSVKKYLLDKKNTINRAIPASDDSFVAVGTNSDKNSVWIFKAKYDKVENK